MSETAKISKWIADLSWEDVPPEVVQKLKTCFRDFLACAFGGSRSTLGQIAGKMALSWGGPPEATIIGIPRAFVACRHAAFANATMANALDYDDTLHGHPGATTFSTALAASEKWGASGKEFLLASVIGYELSVRMMMYMRPKVPRYTAMWDLGTLQAFGAVAASARVAMLTEKEIANALGLLSGTSPVPLPRKERHSGEGRSMLKAAYGWAVDSAIVATEMTLAGFGGPGHALDGNMGFWVLSSDSQVNGSLLSHKLGEEWTILDVEFKPYMACRFIHPVLQGVEEIMEHGHIRGKDVERVEIESFSLLADEHHYIPRPVSTVDAQFSVPYTVAAMLLQGELSPATYNEQMLQNSEVLDLAGRVSVDVDPKFEKAFRNRLGARVRIVTKSGQCNEIEIKHPKGSADQPLGEDDLVRKFHELVDPVTGDRRSNQILSLIHEMTEVEDLGQLSTLLRNI